MSTILWRRLFLAGTIVLVAACSPEGQRAVSEQIPLSNFAAGPRAAQELAQKAIDGDLTALRDLRLSAGDMPAQRTEEGVAQRSGETSPFAQAELAYLYERGIGGVERDPLRALALYAQAAPKVSWAAYDAGLLMYFGDVVPQRITGTMTEPGAIQLFQRAAESKSDTPVPLAAVKLGEIYESGIPAANIAADPAKALDYFDRAAAMRDAYAMMKVGKLRLGLGKRKPDNPSLIAIDMQARISLENAARYWNTEAQYLLGWMYATGNGVEKPDTTLAAQWFIICSSRETLCRDKAQSFLAGITAPQRKAATESAQIWMRNNQRMPTAPNYNQTVRSADLR